VPFAVGETLTITRRPYSSVNRSSVAIALSGALAAGALLFACAGLVEPLFWPAAAASGASSYGLWWYGRRRILTMAYDSTDPDAETRREDRRVTAEDWHRGGFEYRAGDPSPGDDDWDDWQWAGSFWREDPRTASNGTGDRTTVDGGDWSDEDTNWWAGWAEETGETTADGGDRGSARDGDAGGRRRDRRGGTGQRHRGQRQRQVSRAREEAAAVLGVAPDAPPEAVREAFRQRAKETHPDSGGDEASFRRVRWAYEQLRE
jgi:hypothetical protein